ncbi:L,D-transpeptidase family protein [Novosphingobium sp. Chol11]|uniref:L,D-transpeptidase family protein n=1 Tax=Novosphingobium sp. Chol11 TaxID=1385763 RepID=UPI0025FBE959|nr:L,D-transpeptidase family protein [Novosphingobium sp. Chol11]
MRVSTKPRHAGLIAAGLMAATGASWPAASQPAASQPAASQPTTAGPAPVRAAAKAAPAQPPAALPAAPTPSAISAAATPPTIGAPASEVPPVAAPTPLIAEWTLADAKALAAAIKGIASEGLAPADYEPTALAAAIAKGEGPELNALASRLFMWLAEDLRDGRTPVPARVQWFALDTDLDDHPNGQLLAQAIEQHDVPGVLASLAPTHPDYASLKDMLAVAKEPRQRAMIRANMDRWRWLARDLGPQYLIINVPEQELRLTVRNKIIRTYRAIVGKPGKTATPQLAEKVKNVVFNPTWTVPQSIVVGEGLGAKLIASPARAKREGYVATKAADGMITVVQQPGANNALGRVKLDMPNEHAIYIHDTPNRNLFAQPMRALSHGCIRAERATELAMTMAILGSDLPPETAVEYNLSGKYTKVPMTTPWPVYVTYFTVARDVNGLMRSFADLYQRDAPVIASFAAPRALHTDQRTSNEAVIKLDNPL